jgi:hypothetical protein
MRWNRPILLADEDVHECFGPVLVTASPSFRARLSLPQSRLRPVALRTRSQMARPDAICHARAADPPLVGADRGSRLRTPGSGRLARAHGCFANRPHRWSSD